MTQQTTQITLTDGRRLGYSEYGDPQGHPVLFFNGFPGSRLEANRFDGAAKTSQCRLIGVDRPGMGISSFDQSRTILSWADDVSQLVDHLGLDQFSIMGHSAGSAYVAACAYALPDRLIGSAIVSGMAPLTHPQSKNGMPRAMRVLNSLFRTIPGFASLMMRMHHRLLKNPNKMMDRMIQQLPEPDRIIMQNPNERANLTSSIKEAFKFGPAGPAQEIMLFQKPWGFELSDIKSPVSVWHGKLDQQCPISHGNIFANDIPNSKYKAFANEGHLSLIHNHMVEILRSVVNPGGRTVKVYNDQPISENM